jgi:hypothetical protein
VCDIGSKKRRQGCRRYQSAVKLVFCDRRDKIAA